MKAQIFVLTAFAAGCEGAPPDMDVIVFGVEAYSDGLDPLLQPRCRSICGPDDCFIDGDVTAVGENQWECSIPEGTTDIGVDVWGDGRVAETVTARMPVSIGLAEIPVLWVWEPFVDYTELEGRLVASWSPPPARPGTESGSLVVMASHDGGLVELDVTATSASFALEDLEDFDTTIRLQVDQRIDGTDYAQGALDIPAPHSPVLPPSRGAACVVTRQDASGSEDVSFDAGVCPLTDGSIDDSCPDGCTRIAGTVDLGAVGSIRRIRVRGEGCTVSISLDGVTFTEVETVYNDVSFATPVQARYVRAVATAADPSYGVTEISVFTP